MFKFAKPRGFVNWRGNLYIKPDVLKLKTGSPCNIVFLADLHLRRSHPESLELLKAACTPLSPELVLVGGDMTEYPEGLDAVFGALRETFPESAMFAVPGNNDEGDRASQRAALERYKCTLLVNERARYKNVEIAGVEDSYTHTPCVKGLFSHEPGIFRILLSHAPHEFLLQESDPKPDLMLCGHTHGGQINVLGFTCYMLGYESWCKFTHLAGVKHIGKTTCVVSRGIGVSKYPLRIGAKPEIYYITGGKQQ